LIVRGLHKALLLMALLLVPAIGYAYETDQFTNRLNPITDALVPMDRRVNESIEKAVTKWRGRRNDRMMVNKIFHDIGGSHWVDRIERWAWKSGEVEVLQTDRYDNIYSGLPLWATRFVAPFGTGPTIKVAGFYFGTDKLGHFVSQGRKYYFRYLNSLDEIEAGKLSALSEKALFGQFTTGSYSNADLVANFEGYRFFRSLFEDNIIPGKPAILAWKDDHWVIQRKFTWADHVNEYWDEALNINNYDDLLYPFMKERFETFCPDYFSAPEKYQIRDEASLKRRYEHLGLEDSSELRLDSLCVPGKTGPASGATDPPN